MGINVTWDSNDNKVIQMTVEGSWSWDDYYEARAELHTMMDAAPYPVIDVLLNLNHGNMFPKNMISHMTRQSEKTHDKMGMMIVVGAGAFAEALFNIMRRITPGMMRRIKLVDSMDKARGVIHEYRADTLHTRPSSF